MTSVEAAQDRLEENFKHSEKHFSLSNGPTEEDEEIEIDVVDNDDILCTSGGQDSISTTAATASAVAQRDFSGLRDDDDDNDEVFEKRMLVLCNENLLDSSGGGANLDVLYATHTRLKYLYQVLDYSQEKQPLNPRFPSRPQFIVRDFFLPLKYFDVPRIYCVWMSPNFDRMGTVKAKIDEIKREIAGRDDFGLYLYLANLKPYSKGFFPDWKFVVLKKEKATLYNQSTIKVESYKPFFNNSSHKSDFCDGTEEDDFPHFAAAAAAANRQQQQHYNSCESLEKRAVQEAEEEVSEDFGFCCPPQKNQRIEGSSSLMPPPTAVIYHQPKVGGENVLRERNGKRLSE